MGVNGGAVLAASEFPHLRRIKNQKLPGCSPNGAAIPRATERRGWVLGSGIFRRGDMGAKMVELPFPFGT